MRIQDIADTISDIASKISKYGIEDLKMTDEEKAIAGLKGLKKQYSNPINLIRDSDMEAISKQISQSANKTNRDYITLTNRFSNSLKQKNLEEAEKTATLIQQQFENESAFIDLLSNTKNKAKKYNEKLDTKNFNPKSEIGQYTIEEIWKKEKGFNKDIPYTNILGEDGKNLINKGLYTLNGVKGYFNTEDVAKNRLRMGVTGGAYLGVTTLGRLTTGGSPITNQYGERDIAGIPFI